MLAIAMSDQFKTFLREFFSQQQHKRLVNFFQACRGLVPWLK